VTSAQVEKFVREQSARESERFLTPPRDGKSFAYDPRSEWKMDIVYMPDDDGFKYLLVRINSFTRELDGIALKNLETETMEDAVKELLGSNRPRVVLTDGGREFGVCDNLFERLRVQNPGPGYIHFSKALPLEWFKGFTAEVRRTVRTSSGEKVRWVKTAARNEPLDTTVYAMFASQMLDHHKLSDAQWAKLENDLLPDLFALPPAPLEPAVPPTPAATEHSRELDAETSSA
jgi:phage terminase large subunit GpA-like protein